MTQSNKRSPIIDILPTLSQKFSMNEKLTECVKAFSNKDGKFTLRLETSDGDCNRVYVNMNDRIVHVGICVLSCTWSICYFLYVTYNDEIRKYLNDETDIDNAKLQKAENLWHWARSLHYGYTDWPEELPKPKISNIQPEDVCINIFFGFAVEFILAHEIGHLYKNHSEASIENEYEADDFAFDVVISQLDAYPESQPSLIMGVFLGLCAMCLMDCHAEKDLAKHPSSLKRLKRILDNLDVDDENPIWIIGCFMLGVWNGTYNKSVEYPDKIITHHDFFERIYHRIIHNA